MKHVLVTGGAGYIGTHTCVELIHAGFDVTVLDNLSNSHQESIKCVERITGCTIPFVIADIRDSRALRTVLCEKNIDAVIHFAGLKAVGESVAFPLRYYDNNVNGTLSLLDAMLACEVKTLIFSSSATVYGVPEYLPISENHTLQPNNPYGKSKWMVEEILRDFYRSNADWKIGILRYFNPVGAHPSGLIGEDPRGVPNNLLPYVAQVAVGRHPYLKVWGNDYPTHDGTGIRDYIHVVDLARGHVDALLALDAPACWSINLGTGRGYSVLEVADAFRAASGREIPIQICDRREGDVASCFSNPLLAKKLIGWEAKFDLNQMCIDAWRWQQFNPNGYVS